MTKSQLACEFEKLAQKIRPAMVSLSPDIVEINPVREALLERAAELRKEAVLAEENHRCFD